MNSIKSFFINENYNKKILKERYYIEKNYHTETKKMIVEFNNGYKYEYDEIPHQTYTKFRAAESQGKYFVTEISKAYKYKKL